jgi:hypothetical protein
MDMGNSFTDPTDRFHRARPSLVWLTFEPVSAGSAAVHGLGRLSNPGSLFRCSLDGSPSDSRTETDDGQKRNLSLV